MRAREVLRFVITLNQTVPCLQTESAAFWARHKARDDALTAKRKGVYDRAMKRGVVDIHESSKSDSNEEIEMTTSEDEE